MQLPVHHLSRSAIQGAQPTQNSMEREVKADGAAPHPVNQVLPVSYPQAALPRLAASPLTQKLFQNLSLSMTRLRHTEANNDNQTRSLTSRLNQKDNEVKQGMQACQSLKEETDRIRKQANQTKVELSTSAEANAQLKKRVDEEAQTALKLSQQLAATNEETTLLAAKMTLNETSLLCECIKNQTSLLNTLKDKYVNSAFRKGSLYVLPEKEINAIPILIGDILKKVQTLQSHLQTTQSSDDIAVLSNTMLEAREQLVLVEENIHTLAFHVGLDTKDEARQQLEQSKKVLETLIERKNILYDLAQAQNEPLIISSEESRSIELLLADLRLSCSKLLPAISQETLSLKMMLEAWPNLRNNQAIQLRATQKIQHLEKIISQYVQQKAQTLIAEVDKRLNEIPKLRMHLLHLANSEREAIITDEELQKMAVDAQNLKDIKERLYPAWQQIESLPEHMQALRQTTKEINDLLPSLDAMLMKLRGSVSLDSKQTALSLMALAPARTLYMQNLHQTYSDVCQRLNMPSQFEDESPNLRELRDRIQANVEQMIAYNDQGVMSDEQIADLTRLISETEEFIIKASEKITSLAALSWNSLKTERRNLKAEAAQISELLGTLVQEHQNRTRIPALEESALANIADIRAKIERSRQGLSVNEEEVLPTEAVEKKKFLNEQLRQYLELAREQIALLQGYTTDDAKQIAAVLLTQLLNQQRKITRLVVTYHMHVPDDDQGSQASSAMAYLMAISDKVATMAQLKDIPNLTNEQLNTLKTLNTEMSEVKITLKWHFRTLRNELNNLKERLWEEIFQFYQAPNAEKKFDAIYQTLSRSDADWYTTLSFSLAYFVGIGLFAAPFHSEHETRVVEKKQAKARELFPEMERKARAFDEIKAVLNNTH